MYSRSWGRARLRSPAPNLLGGQPALYDQLLLATCGEPASAGARFPIADFCDPKGRGELQEFDWDEVTYNL
jgi:hypothetical protein